MSRIRPLLPAALLLGACLDPPGLKSIPQPTTTTGDSESSSSGDDDTVSTSILTTTDDAGSGAASQSDTTTTTADPDTSTGSSTGDDTTGTSTTSAEPECGDGIVEGDEECDDANGIGSDRCNLCKKNRWIFATAALHNDPTFGGVEGADSLCRQYALQSGRADDSWKTFIAWLSDADHDVRDRLYPGRGRYVRTDGVVVAESIEQLYSGSLAAPINVDEHGNQDIKGGVLTGTLPDGTAAPGPHCGNWTMESLTEFSAYFGSVAATDESWTINPYPALSPNPCVALTARFYCVEGK